MVDNNLPARRFREANAERAVTGQNGLGRTIEVNAQQQRTQVEAEQQLLEGTACHHGHGAALVLAGISAGADPFEECLPAVHLDIEEAIGQRVNGLLAAPTDRPAQFGRRRVAEDQVNVLQMLAKQEIKQGILARRMFVAIPPEPVAALGNVDLLPGPANAVRGNMLLLGACSQMFAGAVQGVPGRVILLMAYPDGEVVVDPAAGKQRSEERRVGKECRSRWWT